jgi:hypothetical protein
MFFLQFRFAAVYVELWVCPSTLRKALLTVACARTQSGNPLKNTLTETEEEVDLLIERSAFVSC